MRIAFIGNYNASLGSDRVHGISLAKFINKLEYYSASFKNETPCELDEEILIFKKGSSYRKIREFKLINPKKLIGITNPSNFDKKSLGIPDFAIVGSIAEKAFYADFLPCFVYPQIEEISSKSVVPFHNRPKKVLCYHGNKMHIDYLDKNLNLALRELVDDGYKFKAIYNIRELGKSKNKFITEHIQWDINTWITEVANSTIGICPSSHYSGTINMALAKFFTSFGGFPNDIVSRNKNTINAGRAFIFHQLEIPVVAEISGPHYHLLGNELAGDLCYSKKSWINAIRDLTASEELQMKKASKAKEYFEKLYDPNIWANRLLEKIGSLYRKKLN